MYVPKHDPDELGQSRSRRDPEHLKRVVTELQKLDARMRFNRLEFYRPYAKQQQFHDMGLALRERLLLAGNRNGKTYCGAAELSMHLTGRYPDWWLGRRWDRPTKWWAAGVTGVATRDVVQTELLGEAGVKDLAGSGMIPKDCVDWNGITTARGVADFYDMVPIKHVSGGWSILKFKTFDQGRQKWQGTSLDGVWYDEEPDEEIYSEGTARIGDRDGLEYVTFTPMEGRSKVVMRFLDEYSPNRGTVTMTIEDAEHLSPEQRQRMIDGYLPHEREARAMGRPLLGSGRIFLTTEEQLKVDKPDPLPRHWFYLWGFDFGGVSDKAHPWAAVLLGHDRDADVMTVCAAFRETGLRIGDEARLLKNVMPDAPVAWPQDGTAKEKTSGETLATTYRAEGLKMLDEHATHKEGGISTEAGIRELDEAMKGGKFKVAKHLEIWFDEYRDYHRKDGLIVKLKDDILSATRIGWMMRRKAKQVDSLDPWKRLNGGGGRKILQAKTDFNPYTGE